jgi:hypothetical protein
VTSSAIEGWREGYRRLEGRWGPAVGGEATGGAGGLEATGEPEEESEAEADE